MSFDTPEGQAAMQEYCALASQVGSDPEARVKFASVNGTYIRRRMREGSIHEAVHPPTYMPDLSNKIKRSADTDRPVLVFDKEPDGPPAAVLGYGGVPITVVIKGSKLEMPLARLSTPIFTVDPTLLLTYTSIDLRQVVSDNAVRDLQAEIDNHFMNGLTVAMVAQGTVTASAGVAQWVVRTGGVTKANILSGFKQLRSTRSQFGERQLLMNDITKIDVLSLDRDAIGDAQVARSWSDGDASIKDPLNMKWNFTIKRAMVPDNAIFYFADMDLVAKHVVFKEPTMHTDGSVPDLIQFHVRTERGAILGNTNGVARVDITP